jgi:hypothetical protein
MAPHDDDRDRFLFNLNLIKAQQPDPPEADVLDIADPKVYPSDPDLAISQLQGLIDQPPQEPVDMEPVPVLEAQQIEAEQGLEPGTIRSAPTRMPDTIGPPTVAPLDPEAARRQEAAFDPTAAQQVEQFIGGTSGPTGAVTGVTNPSARRAKERVEQQLGRPSTAATVGHVTSYFTDLIGIWGTARAAAAAATRAGMPSVARALSLFEGRAGLADNKIIAEAVAEDMVLNATRLARGEVDEQTAAFDALIGLAAGTTLRAGNAAFRYLKPAKVIEEAKEIASVGRDVPELKAAFQMPDGSVRFHEGPGVGSHGEVLLNQDEAVAKLISDGEGAGQVISGFVDPADGRFLTRAEAAQATGAKVGESSFIDEALGRGVGGDELPYLPGTEKFVDEVPEMPAQSIIEVEPGQAQRAFTQIIDGHKANGGSTIDWRTGRDLGGKQRDGKDIYTLAVHTGDDMVISGRDLTPVDIQDFARQFADDLSEEGRTIGTWFDEETGRHVLDVVEVMDDRAKALRAGAQRGQDAIFDLTNFNEIRLTDELLDPPSKILNVATRTGLGGTFGGAIGAATGDTYEEKVRNAAIGAIGGAFLGFGLPAAKGREGFLRLTGTETTPPWWGVKGREFWARPENAEQAMRKFADPEAYSGLLQWRGIHGRELRKQLMGEFPDATPTEIDAMITKGRAFKEARLNQVMSRVVVSERGIQGRKLKKVPPPPKKKGAFYEISNPFGTKGGKKFDSMIHALLAEGFESDGWMFYHDVGRVIKEAFGETDGDMYLKFLAITSTGTNAMSTNITAANQAFMLWKTTGKAMRQKEGSKLFAGVGRRDVSEMLNAATRGERFSKSEKLHRYYKALNGDENAVVIDLWMNRLFGFGDAVSDTQYRFIEQEIFRLANATGKSPRDIQAALWSGAKAMWAREASNLGITEGTAYAPHLINKMTEMAGDVSSSKVEAAMGEVLNFVRHPRSKQAKLFKKAFLEQEVEAQEKYLAELAKTLRDEKGAVGVRQLVQMLTVMGGAAGGAALNDDPLQGAILGAALGSASIGAFKAAREIPGVSNSFINGKQLSIDVGNWFRKQGRRALSTTGTLAETTKTSPSQLHASRIRRSGRVKAETERAAVRMDAVDKIAKEAGIDPAAVWDQAQKVRATGGSMQNAFPPEWPQALKTALRQAYDQQDQLSRELRAQGWLSGTLEQIIKDNEGTYLRRAYRAFTEPKWADTVKRKHIEVYNDAVNWLEQRMTIPHRMALEGMSRDELLSLAGRYDLGFPVSADRDVLIQALDAIPRTQAAEDAAVLADRLLELGEDGILGAIRSGRMGEKDLRALRRRGDIAPEIRALLGEIKDPKVNLMNSIHSTSRLIADHQFQVEFRGMGIQGGWLSHGPDRVRGHSIQLVPEGSKRADVLANVYTTPEVAGAYRAFTNMSPVLGDNIFWDQMLYLSSIPRLFKTVGNYTTHIRNFLSNPAFKVANMDFFMAGGATPVRVKESLQTIAQTALRDAKRRDRWYELGLLGEAARAEEITQFLKATRRGPERIIEQGIINAPGLGKVAKGAATAYRWEDEVWKVHAFEARLWNESHWRHGVRPDQLASDVKDALELRLSQEVLDTYPTYSITPGLAKVVRSMPFVGPFVSWHVAVPINAINTVKRLARNLKSDVPQIRAQAVMQGMGILAAAGGTTAIRMTANRRAGLDMEEELAIREFMPEWNRNGAPVFHEWDPISKTGKYMAGHQFDANDMMKAPVRALLAGVANEEDIDRIMVEALRETMDPFISEDLFWGAIIDVTQNRDEYGRFIANPGETRGEQWEDRVSYVWDKMRPGTLDVLARLRRGSMSDDPEKMEAEVMAALGARVSVLDVKRSLSFQASDFTEKMRESVSDLRRATPDQRNQEMRDAVAGQLQAFHEFQRKIAAAKTLRVDNGELETILKGAGLRADVREALIDGRFLPWLPSTLEGDDPEATQFLLNLYSRELQQ